MAVNVKFGSTNATSITVVNDTTITCKAPAGTGTVDVVVTTLGGSATKTSGYVYT